MKKIVKIILITVIAVFLLIGGVILFFVSNWTERTVVKEIAQYEAYFGPDGIHRTIHADIKKKTGESYLVINDIFPEKLPESANAEDFYYEYYNPWDPCYLGYLVYTCDEGDYEAETARLKAKKYPEHDLIYGATGFNYPVLAVSANDYGYIYALADEAGKRLIYVELTFCNGFTDIDYEKIIPEKYLPVGFNAGKERKK